MDVRQNWVPDHNWGGSGMIGLQEMLMQTVGDQILIFPAWPETWDVDFKLHAPHNTIVQGRLRNGEIVELTVHPESRRKDLIVMEHIREGETFSPPIWRDRLKVGPTGTG